VQSCFLCKDRSPVANRSLRQQRRSCFRLAVLFAIACGILIAEVPQTYGEEAAIPQTAATSNSSMDDQIDAAEADRGGPRRQLVSWNRYEGPYITLRVGLGFGYDYAAYAQDANSKEQMTLSPAAGTRDFRFLFAGRSISIRSVLP
jgi:hypothetical protein